MIFDILDANGKLASTVQKTYGKGRGCEACCRCTFMFDNYIVEFPPTASAEERLLLIAAVMQTEYAVFSRKGGEGGDNGSNN